MLKFLFELIEQLLPITAIFLCVFFFGLLQVSHLKLNVKVNEQSEQILLLEQNNKQLQMEFDNLAADFVTLSKLPADSKIEFSNFKMNEKLVETSSELEKLKSSIVDKPEEILALYKLKAETKLSLQSLTDGQKHLESQTDTKITALQDKVSLLLNLCGILFFLMVGSIAVNFKSGVSKQQQHNKRFKTDS